MMLTLVLIGNLILAAQVSSKNIGKGDGGFCFKQIPKNSVLGTCSADEDCNDLLDSTHFRCGAEGECVSQYTVTHEICHGACESSPCGKLCSRNYRESAPAKYCVRSRDHEGGPSLPTEPKQFFCTCVDPKN